MLTKNILCISFSIGNKWKQKEKWCPLNQVSLWTGGRCNHSNALIIDGERMQCHYYVDGIIPSACPFNNSVRKELCIKIKPRFPKKGE